MDTIEIDGVACEVELVKDGIRRIVRVIEIIHTYNSYSPGEDPAVILSRVDGILKGEIPLAEAHTY